MAWIDSGPYYEWDVPYPDQVEAATRALKLAEQYKIFTDTLHQPEEQCYLVITQNRITEAHSIACRCDACTLF